MKTVVIGAEFGGETATAGKIENWPSIKSIDGYDLMQLMKDQVESLGVEIKEERVSSIQKQGSCFEVVTKNATYHTRMVLLATGSQRRHLNIAREKELTNRGVHYCVTCDGPLYGGKIIAMVGGGDSSVKGINFLAEYAKKIYFIVKGKEVRAEPVNKEYMDKLGEKVETLLETEVKELIGEKMLEGVRLSKEYKESDVLKIDGLFVEIGFNPDQTFTKQLGIETDEKGYVKADNLMRTNVPGVYVAGDATRHFGDFKQDITASALGTVAATSAFEYLKQNKEACPLHK